MRTREEIYTSAVLAAADPDPQMRLPAFVYLELEVLLDIRDLLAADRVTTAAGADRFVTEIKR